MTTLKQGNRLQKQIILYHTRTYIHFLCAISYAFSAASIRIIIALQLLLCYGRKSNNNRDFIAVPKGKFASFQNYLHKRVGSTGWFAVMCSYSQ